MSRPWSLALSLALLSIATPLINADDAADSLDQLFQGDLQEPVTGQQAPAPSLLDEYNRLRDKTSWSYNLYAAAGEYLGWAAPLDFADPAAGFAHSSLGTLSLNAVVDLRPWDYLRVHGAATFSYPTALGSVYDFGMVLNDFFFDYATPDSFSVRVGRYAVSWGNARILGIADLPGRVSSMADATENTDLLPDWLTGNNPSLWFKAAIPLGHLTTSILTGLPDAPAEGLSSLPYGILNEYVTGKTSLSLGGYYEDGRPLRGVFMVKSAAFGLDLYADSVLTLPSQGVLFGATGGLSYVTSSGPDITTIAELRWNGENPGTGSIVSDAMSIAGLSNAVAVTWRSVFGSDLTLALTWYHAWVDSSGAVVPALSLGVGRLLTIKAVLPVVYGEVGTEYRVDPPSEAAGYLTGLGVFLVLNASF